MNAGHGLNYVNTRPVASIAEIDEVSIGHAVITRAIYAGMDRAVREMLAIVQGLACQAALDPDGKLPVRPEDAADLALSMIAPASPRRLGRASHDGAAVVVLPA